MESSTFIGRASDVKADSMAEVLRCGAMWSICSQEVPDARFEIRDGDGDGDGGGLCGWKSCR
jgi:hypothetical protein